MKFAFLIFALFVSVETHSGLTDREREDAVNYLQETKKYVLEAIKGLSKAQLNYKIDSAHWSIAECIEHIALSESRIRMNVSTSINKPAEPARRTEMKYTDDQIKNMLVNRDTKAQSPEGLKPSVNPVNTEDLVKSFSNNRDNLIEYVQTTQDDLRNHFAGHRALGLMDSYQWILLISGHSKRHALQIEEIKAHSGFPSK